MSVQNVPHRAGFIGVSVLVDATPRHLATLVEQVLGIASGTLATIFREVTIQIDPEVSGSASVRFGTGNVGATVAQTTPSGNVVQKAMTLTGASVTPGGGIADTLRGPVNQVYFGSIWVQSVSGTAVLNIALWSM